MKKRYFMTCSALFFLGVIVAKPGTTFHPTEKERECKVVKGKMDCQGKLPDYKRTHNQVRYEF